MKIDMICPRWGCENLEPAEFVDRVQAAGYDGIEVAMGEPDPKAETVIALARDRGLVWITQHFDVFDREMDGHLRKLEERLRMLMEYGPRFVNSHTGRNLFSLEENLRVFDTAEAVAEDMGVPVKHETHRGRCGHTPWTTLELLRARPGTRWVMDMSHWCNVCESLLEDQADMLEGIVPAVDHVHARVGWQHGPQVSDPRAPEWGEAVEAHLIWWDRWVAGKREAGEETITICPEFGPAPYTPVLPYTRQPVSDPWEINRHMMEMLRDRYEE